MPSNSGTISAPVKRQTSPVRVQPLATGSVTAAITPVLSGSRIKGIVFGATIGQPLRAEFRQGTANGVNWTLERSRAAGIVGHNDATPQLRLVLEQHRAALPLQGRQECRVGNCPQLKLDFVRIDVL